MTKRLWIIIAVGVIAIALTWFIVNKPEPDPTDDPAYKEQLKKLHEKQEEKKKEKEAGGEATPGQTGGSSGSGNTGESGSTTGSDPGPSGDASHFMKPKAPIETSDASLIRENASEKKNMTARMQKSSA